jgi:hypothetical protein
MCRHRPTCPAAEALDRDAARIIASHPEQGWSLRCNGVVTFDDTGDLLPDGRVIAPRRPHPSEQWSMPGELAELPPTQAPEELSA